jgi:predicted nuclease of predicted toxin-antitoxin system
MRLLADEGVHRGVVDGMREAGFEIEYVAETKPGSSDGDVLETAKRNSAVLVTEDKDFGELVFRQRLTNRGVILLRMHGHSASQQTKALLDFVKNHGDTASDAFSVISATGFRIRHQQQ